MKPLHGGQCVPPPFENFPAVDLLDLRRVNGLGLPARRQFVEAAAQRGVPGEVGDSDSGGFARGGYDVLQIFPDFGQGT